MIDLEPDENQAESDTAQDEEIDDKQTEEKITPQESKEDLVEEPETKPESEPDPEPEPESKSEPEPEPEPEPAMEPMEEKTAGKKPKKGSEKKGDEKLKKDKEGKVKGDKQEDEVENPDFKYIIRVANTNLDGNLMIPYGLTGIKGIGIRLGIAITDNLDFPRDKKLGDLTDAEVEKLIKIVDNINEEFPGWMLNRQNDYEIGTDIHIISSDIQRQLRDDLNRLKKIRCYRGIRHEQGQKVRGQRTRSNGRTGMTVGVQRKKVQQQTTKK